MKQFTPDQIQELIDVIRAQHLTFSIQNIGKSILTTEDEKILSKYGIKIPEDSPSKIDEAYKFGKLSMALKKEEVESMNYTDFKKFVANGKMMPYTDKEKSIIEYLKQKTYSHIKNLEGKIGSDLKVAIFNKQSTHRAQYEKLIQNELLSGAVNRKSLAEIVSDLGRKTQDYSRDFGRIVATEMHNAFEFGRASQLIAETGKDDPEVYKHTFNGVCKYCIKAYLKAGLSSEPKIFKLSTLIANGTNIGKKAENWLPVLGALHPWCFDDKTEVLTNNGFKFFKDLDKTEKFMSINLEKKEIEYVKAINWINEKYIGKMHLFSSKSFNLKTTPNHHHIIKYLGVSKKLYFIETKNLTDNHAFLRNTLNWVGLNKNNIKIGNISYDSKLFCEFMGFYISEGSFVYQSCRYIINISQSQSKYYSDIKKCVKILFKNRSIYYEKEVIKIGLLKEEDKHLIQYLKQLGKSFEKYIPKNIKELSKELLEIFLDAYCKGDGSCIKITEEKGNCYSNKTLRKFYSSSKRLSDDTAELILKTGKRPSFTIRKPTPVFCKRQNKSYLSKYNSYIIRENLSKYTNYKSLNKSIEDYDGQIYDVELEKNHILVVRREGRVTVSSNCRCTLNQSYDNQIYNPETRMYKRDTSKWKPTIESKSTVKIIIGDKSYKINSVGKRV